MRFYRVRVVRRLTHPGRGFTQGLLADENTVWESTGGYGESTLARYQLGDVDREAELASETDVARETMELAALPARLFGEGICRVGDDIWQLTWKERVALRWDAATLKPRGKVQYNRDGWGICTVTAGVPEDGRGAGADQGAGPGGSGIEVVTSDGTSELVRRDPETLEPRAMVRVRCRGSRVRGLNDLAWDGARVWANVAGTACLAGIDLATGEVTDVADARAAAERHLADPQAIMNGIAALAEPGEFLLTGKRWRAIRHVRLCADRDRGHLRRLLDGLSR